MSGGGGEAAARRLFEGSSAVYYIIDGHLDDSHKWAAGLFPCKACKNEYSIVFRVDVEPFCPSCGDRSRVRPRRVDAADA